MKNKNLFILSLLLIGISFLQLFASPNVSMNGRQCFGCMLTKNFVQSGFHLSGFTLDMYGNDHPIVIMEFPFVYIIAGFLYRLTGVLVFWGKLISLMASLGTLIIIHSMMQKKYGKMPAFWGGLFFVFCPIGMLIRTAYQPDALGVFFMMLALLFLDKWRHSQKWQNILLFSLSLLMAGLLKFPLLVPFIPIIVAGYFVHNSTFKRPSIYELVIPIIFFLIPFLSWYLFAFRFSVNQASIDSDTAVSMFFIGDLRRFLHLRFYLKPIAFIAVYVLSLAGFAFVVAGLFKSKWMEWLLTIGVPVYFILIPTVAGQHYYLYATLPIFAVLFGLGSSSLQKLNKWFPTIVFLMMTPGFLIASNYLLRSDKVMDTAAQAVKLYSGKEDKVLTILTHDRIYPELNPAPELFYLSERKGWTVPFSEIEDNINNLNQYIAQGGHWLVVTWYTSDLEPWFINWIPASFARKPAIEINTTRNTLMEKYECVVTNQNYALLDLSTPLHRLYAPDRANATELP